MDISKKDNQFILRWAKKIKAIQLLGEECKECRNKNVFQLDFHHKKDKVINVHDLINKNYRWSVIEAEAKKCDLMCRNCHSEYHTNSEGRGQKAKRKILRSLKCEDCEYVGKNLGSLDFHHVEPSSKLFNIADAVHRKVNINAKDLECELLKCEIICKNCHIMRHVDVAKFEKFELEIYRRVKNHNELKKPVDVNAIIALKDEGKTQTQIAKELGYAKSTICRIFKELQ